MQILFTRFPLESADGGAEKQTVSLWEGLMERGHDVSFVGSCPVLLEKSCKLQVASCKLSIGPPPVTKWGVISFLWRKKKMQRQLLEQLRKLTANRSTLDAICMLSLSEKLLLTPWAVKQGVNVIWIEHDTVGRWLTKNPWLPELRRLSRDVTTVTVSELSRQLYIKMGWQEDDVIGIANGVDIFKTPLPNPLPKGEGMKIGTMSRLTPDKGVDVLVHAVADLPNTALTIIGRGNGEGYIRKLIAEMEEREHVQGDPRIRLQTDRVDLCDFFASIDVFVLPSRQNDPFGLVAAEAMMAGVPVIVTDQCGIGSHLIYDKHALVVAADNSAALRDAILKLEDAALRKELALSGQKHAMEEFTVKKMVERYEQLLTKQPLN